MSISVRVSVSVSAANVSARMRMSMSIGYEYEYAFMLLCFYACVLDLRRASCVFEIKNSTNNRTDNSLPVLRSDLQLSLYYLIFVVRASCP